MSFRDYTVFLVVLKFCGIHKTRLSDTPLKPENAVISAYLWWYFSKKTRFNYAAKYYIVFSFPLEIKCYKRVISAKKTYQFQHVYLLVSYQILEN